VRLSLDDFGTGNSSLSYLQRLPVTAVKIDKSFVEPLLTDDTAREIVRAVVNLAHSLSLSVIARGRLRTGHGAADSARLRRAASFYVASPMSPARLEQWIAVNSPASPPSSN